MKVNSYTGKLASLALVSLVLVGFFQLPPTTAAPPSGKGKTNPPPAGRIHIGTRELDEDEFTFTVGRSLLADTTELQDSETGHPSHMLHQSQRWFLRGVNICLERDVDGNCVKQTQEVLAVRESDGFEVQLTDDPSLLGCWSPRWSKDDSVIGFIGVVSGVHSIYTAEISFDANGIPGLTTSPSLIVTGGPTFVVDGITMRTDINYFDFSPNGTRVVWSREIREEGIVRTSDPKDLLVSDLSTGEDFYLFPGVHPEWSPDGLKIVFGWNHDSGARGGIAVINPDGSGYLELTTDSAKVLYDQYPTWSPDSKNVAFRRFYTPSNRGGRTNFVADVFRISANGEELFNLTDSLNDATVYGWR